MKYIFLDFDGVINNWDHFEGVAKENAIILKRIIDISGAMVVVTSSNKYVLQCNPRIDYYSSNFYNVYVKELNKFGIQIFDLTPMCGRNRSLEIKRYIQEHNVSDYVIVDDELVNFELQDHQVFLDLYRGLQVEHIKPIISILNGKLGFYPSEYDRSETAEELNFRINKYYAKKMSQLNDK